MQQLDHLLSPKIVFYMFLTWYILYQFISHITNHYKYRVQSQHNQDTDTSDFEPQYQQQILKVKKYICKNPSWSLSHWVIPGRGATRGHMLPWCFKRLLQESEMPLYMEPVHVLRVFRSLKDLQRGGCFRKIMSFSTWIVLSNNIKKDIWHMYWTYIVTKVYWPRSFQIAYGSKTL